MMKVVYKNGLDDVSKFRDIDLAPVYVKDEVTTEETSLGDRGLLDDDVMINQTYSEYVTKFISINREPFSFAGREYLKRIYNGWKKHPATKIILVAGRQVEKSSTLAAFTLVRMAIKPFHYALIVEPRLDQVRVFSHQRLRLMAEDSEILAQSWLGGNCQWQVGVREMRNRSVAYLRSCYYSADPLRGITAGDVFIDEIQDIISDNIPVIEECQSHVPEDERLNIYSGTPNTTSNTLSIEYANSCQFEWMVKCRFCPHWNYLDEKVIGPKFFICVKCGKELYPKKPKNIDDHNDFGGEWIAMRPSRIDITQGYRIPQIMVPFMSHKAVLTKMNDPQRSQRTFFNEVLGLPYDAGQLVLVEADIRSVCEERPMDTPQTASARGLLHLCAGLDHGTGGYTPLGMGSGRSGARSRAGNQASYTVLAHGGFCRDGKFRIVNIMKYVGDLANLAKQPGVISDTTRRWGTKWVMSDAGFGGQTNSRLIEDYGFTRTYTSGQPMLMECEYVNSRKLARFDPASYRYIVDRNYVIEKFVTAIKRGDVLFFRQADMEEFMNDFISMYVEYSALTNRIRYDHNRPDDCFHACLYCYLAALQHCGKFVPSGYGFV
jgi:hypothetical protein